MELKSKQTFSIPGSEAANAQAALMTANTQTELMDLSELDMNSLVPDLIEYLSSDNIGCDGMLKS